eukprot:scaffold9555_cov123-Isochrysis_galbana.AAC.9
MAAAEACRSSPSPAALDEAPAMKQTPSAQSVLTPLTFERCEISRLPKPVPPACEAHPDEPMPMAVASEDLPRPSSLSMWPVLTMHLRWSVMPACDAPPCDPLPMRVGAALASASCSAVKLRLLASASLAPSAGPVNPGTICARRPSECRLVTTASMFLFSKRSTVWKDSNVGMPSAVQAFK